MRLLGRLVAVGYLVEALVDVVRHGREVMLLVLHYRWWKRAMSLTDAIDASPDGSYTGIRWWNAPGGRPGYSWRYLPGRPRDYGMRSDGTL